MCVFTGPAIVTNTKIFARIDGFSQVLIYQMEFETDLENAMVLPIPVEQNERENAVEFTDLSGYENLFKDLNMLFPRETTLSLSASRSAPVSAALEVIDVGSFEASYVPQAKDFIRLDERFRLKDSVLAKLPDYADYAFVVFKLKPGKFKVHPMAFKFKTRSPFHLYYPTVHVHDDEVHPLGDFSHTLYAQGRVIVHQGLRRSIDKILSSVHEDLNRKSKGLVDKNTNIFRQTIEGPFKNQDCWVKLK